MGTVVSGWRSRLGDAVAEGLSALLTPRTVSARLFPEAVQVILDQPDMLEVLSLDPADYQNGDPLDRFLGHAILGQVAVTSTTERARIGRALVAGNRRTGPSFKCFDPYIGVVAERDGVRVSLAACFWCGNVEVAGSGSERRIYPLSGWPARPLVRQLAAAGIELPKPPE
jgi:hypothetical protein